MFKRRGRKPKVTIIKRLFRSLLSIVVLTAFVLGISLFVKELATFNPDKAVKFTGPIWKKIGVSQDLVGEVAGIFAERLLKTNISPSKNFQNEILDSSPSADISNNNSTGDIMSGESSIRPVTDTDYFSTETQENSEIMFKVAFLADSHNENENLKEALEKAKELKVHSVFFLGDYTAWGSIAELEDARQVMDDSGVLYYSLPGDHDLGQSIGLENYETVFSDKQERVVEIKGTKFVMLDNSANKTAIEDSKLEFFKNELTNADFVLLSQPLYHYSSPSVVKPLMGYSVINGELIEVASVRDVALELLGFIRNSSVKAIVAADHHSFSVSQDLVREDLMHIVVGPVAKEGAYQSRTSISILTQYADGSYSIQEEAFN